MRIAAVLIALVMLVPAPQAAAQRGAQHLNSPGYQRALIESRKPKAEPTLPVIKLTKKRIRRGPAE